MVKLYDNVPNAAKKVPNHRHETMSTIFLVLGSSTNGIPLSPPSPSSVSVSWIVSISVEPRRGCRSSSSGDGGRTVSPSCVRAIEADVCCRNASGRSGAGKATGYKRLVEVHFEVLLRCRDRR